MTYTKILEELQCSLNDAFRETAQSILELATKAKSLWLSRSPKERRDFLDKILSSPVLNGLNIEFDLRKPFATIAEMASKIKIGVPKLLNLGMTVLNLLLKP